jgi:hypothetical protein
MSDINTIFNWSFSILIVGFPTLMFGLTSKVVKQMYAYIVYGFSVSGKDWKKFEMLFVNDLS